jgi:WD40 repeat protein
VRQSPFKFLDSYTKDDRKIFFGREREIEELYHRVFESKIMLVYGVSGTGKSSLIHCGLANKFQDTDWLPIVIRRGVNIVDSMAAGIMSASITAQKAKMAVSEDFKKGIKSLYLDYYKPVFFIFDQFEELFIFGDKDERRSFIHIVKSLLDSELQCRLIFIMREEYMAGVTEFEKFIPTFFTNRVRIEKMSHRNALEAIKGPCNVFNISLEDGFGETLLEKLSPGSEDVELTYLQVFLDKIFRLAVNENESQKSGQQISFTLPHLNKTGNVSDLLGSFLDDQILLMEDPDTAMSVLKAFVSGRGTKRPADETDTINNVQSLGKVITPEKVKELILSFVNLRVLRDKDDNGRYELRHDALAEKIYEKFSTAEKELLEIRQMIENAYQYYLKRKILLSNEDLAYISNKDSILNLSPELRGFMDECRQHQEAKKRAVTRLIIFSGLAFLILLSTIGYTLLNRSNKSKSILLAKESVIQFTRPIDRLCLASAAWESYPTVEAKEALFKSFNACIRNQGEDKDLIDLRNEYLVKFDTVSSSIKSAACSRDGRFIYGYSKDSVFVWGKNGELHSAFSIGNSPLISARMSDDGKYLAAVNTDSMLIAWDNLGYIKFSRKTGYNSVNKDQIFRFTKENRILAISDNQDADLIDINGNSIQSFDKHMGNINAVDISGDGRFIATAGSDSSVYIWYFNSDENRFDFYSNIHFPADTIWSVDFAKNCKYILTSATNGTIRVTNVNGQVAWGVREDLAGGDYRNLVSLGYPFFAEFNESGTGMIIKSAEQENEIENYYMSAIYVDIWYHIAQTGQTNKFDYIKFSPDNKYLIASKGDDNFLLSWTLYMKSDYALVNNYQLLQITGREPFFSPDGRYIYSICGNHIESWFIDVESISRIALDLYNKWDSYL